VDDFLARHKRKLIVAAVVAVALGTMGTVMNRVQVEAGHEAIMVDKPFFSIFDGGGVRPEPFSTGSTWLFYTTEIIRYDLRPFQHTEKFDDAIDGTITADNIPIDFNAYIKVRPISGKTPRLHASFGPNWYPQNLKEVFRTSVRDEVAKYTMTVLTTRQANAQKDVLGDIQRHVIKEMRDFVKDKGIDAEVMEVIVGKVTPPQKILDQLAETANQQQRAQTEIQRTAAEIQRKNAERERANADNEYRNKIGYSVSEFLSLEIAKKQVEALKECGAKASCTAIIGQLGVQATLPLQK